MIGQNLHAGKASEQVNVQQMNLTPEEQAQLSRPISDLNLSVRARKCMSRLALSTLGELVHRTADELLSSRNFGVTSLNEIRGRLSEIDLKLRND
jgi:DNA-directed RNA polymerase subunit alpha